jgi:hypothetical protein
MADDLKARITARAFALWEAEGQPGRADAHWMQATNELSSDRQDVAAATDYVMQTDEKHVGDAASPAEPVPNNPGKSF